MNTKRHFPSRETVVGTPGYRFDGLNVRFGFGVDACASADNAKLPGRGGLPTAAC